MDVLLASAGPSEDGGTFSGPRHRPEGRESWGTTPAGSEAGREGHRSPPTRAVPKGASPKPGRSKEERAWLSRFLSGLRPIRWVWGRLLPHPPARAAIPSPRKGALPRQPPDPPRVLAGATMGSRPLTHLPAPRLRLRLPSPPPPPPPRALKVSPAPAAAPAPRKGLRRTSRVSSPLRGVGSTPLRRGAGLPVPRGQDFRESRKTLCPVEWRGSRLQDWEGKVLDGCGDSRAGTRAWRHG